ncbi:MAG: hypothetical protein J5I98_22755 [Phaeodactylibacter sp.]|nr:hypothetical protein [Phaeodactylibacter sp.]
MLFGVRPFQGRLGLALYGGSYFSWWNRGMYGDDRAEKPTLLERMMSDARKTHLEKSYPLRKGRDAGLKAVVEAYLQFSNKGRLALGFFCSHGLKDFQYSEADSSPKFRFRQYSVSTLIDIFLDTEYADLPAARRGLAGREGTEPHRDLIINGKNSVYSVLVSVFSGSKTILSSGVFHVPGLPHAALRTANSQQPTANHWLPHPLTPPPAAG